MLGDGCIFLMVTVCPFWRGCVVHHYGYDAANLCEVGLKGWGLAN